MILRNMHYETILIYKTKYYLAGHNINSYWAMGNHRGQYYFIEVNIK